MAEPAGRTRDGDGEPLVSEWVVKAAREGFGYLAGNLDLLSHLPSYGIVLGGSVLDDLEPQADEPTIVEGQ